MSGKRLAVLTASAFLLTAGAVQAVTPAQLASPFFPDAGITVEIKDQYRNMRELIEPHMFLIENAEAAFRACGTELVIIPIRGGTDGARLTYEGLPCPNLSTGGHNFHSNTEYIPVQSMEKMVEVLTELARTK